MNEKRIERDKFPDEKRGGNRRKNGKKKNTRNVILEERECREDRRIKRKKNVGERTQERLSGGGRKDYERLKRKQQ